MDVFRAIYTSRPFGFDQSMLSGILMDARHANNRDGITGALQDPPATEGKCRHGR